MDRHTGARFFKFIAGLIIATAIAGATGSSASADETTVSAYVHGGGAGSVSSFPAGIDECRDECSASFIVGDEITMTATPDPGMGFTGWGGVCATEYATRDGNVCTFLAKDFDFVVNGPQVYFEPRPANDDFADATSFSASGDEVNQVNYQTSGVSIAATHEPGEPTHAADGGSGSIWAKWTAPAFSQVTASACFNYTDYDTALAVYTGSALSNLQKIASNDNGTPFTSCDGQTPSGFDARGMKSELSFAAIKGVTYYFAVDGENGDSGQYLLGLFETRTPRPVEISIGGSGEGRVLSSPAGIDCDSLHTASTCATTIGDSRDTVLTAYPALGSTFEGFGGACSGTAPCALTVMAPTDVTASFKKIRHDLKISRSGTGSGRIRYVGATTPDCDKGSCVSTHDYGTVITLQPIADKGSKFMGWSGDCTGTGPCQANTAKDIDVSANFDAPVVLKIGKPLINARKGTALIPATVDQSATIKVTGTGLKSKVKRSGSARTVKMPVNPKGKLLRALKLKGKAKVKVVVTATGASGKVTRAIKTVRLKRNR